MRGITKEEAQEKIAAEWTRAENVTVTDVREGTGGVFHAWTTWTVDGLELTENVRLQRDIDDSIQIQ